MNNAHLHIIINHLPLTFMVLGFIVMLMGFLIKSDIVKRVAYLIFILGALFGLATFYSGESAKELVKGLKVIDPRILTIHEEAALAFLALLYVLGGLSLLGLWASWQKKTYAKIISFIIMAFSFVVIYFAVQAGFTGGEIRHSEIENLN